MELVKEELRLCQKAGGDSSQILLEGDIIVPDTKPDIASCLRVGGNPVLTQVNGEEGRIGFQGALQLSILYQAKKSDKLIHSMYHELPIDDFLNIDGIEKGDFAEIMPELSHLEYHLVNDRKINIKAIVTLHASYEKERTYQIVKRVEDGQTQTKMGSMKIDSTVENKRDRFTVKEDVMLPSGKPNIQELLTYDASIGQKEIKCMDGKVWISGTICLSVLYLGEQEESVIEVCEQDIPFNGYVEAKNVRADMLDNSKVMVEDAIVTVGQDDDGEDRVLSAEVAIGAHIKVLDNKEMELVEDAYALHQQLHTQAEQIQYPQFVGKNDAQSTIKEVIVVDAEAPEMMQVEKVWGTVQLDEVELMEDKLYVEGVIHLSVLYIAKDDENPVGIVEHAVPFQQEIEVKGARSDMQVDVSAAIEEITFNMLSEREVEIRTLLDFTVFVVKMVDGEVIVDILQQEDDGMQYEPKASAIIYFVQPGDTLWNIAKQYYTTVDEIAGLNQLEDPNKIYPGQRLLILRDSTMTGEHKN